MSDNSKLLAFAAAVTFTFAQFSSPKIIFIQNINLHIESNPSLNYLERLESLENQNKLKKNDVYLERVATGLGCFKW